MARAWRAVSANDRTQIPSPRHLRVTPPMERRIEMMRRCPLIPVWEGQRSKPSHFRTLSVFSISPHCQPLFLCSHDLFMEISGRYDYSFNDPAQVFVYGGPVAEPALGQPTLLRLGRPLW